MKVSSVGSGDIPQKKSTPGSYEWWYFDAGDDKGAYHFVVIFYEGCPFSPRYMSSVKKRPHHPDALASQHPAVSISVYHHGKPVFYSFTQYSPFDAEFNHHKVKVRIGNHTMEAFEEAEQIAYSLRLDEILPDGTKFNAILRFTSPPQNPALFVDEPASTADAHAWNLSQAAAKVKGVISISRDGRKEKPIVFEGTGYHDHNIGSEPLRNQFTEWYWGRVHFNEGTFVYYLMEEKGVKTWNAWWIRVDNARIEAKAESIRTDATFRNTFGLAADTRFTFTFPERTVELVMRSTVDSGPFYYRFLSDASTHDRDGELLERTNGISEFIHAERITWRRFWPFVKMRLRYADKRPNLVQRFRFLYKLTW